MEYIRYFITNPNLMRIAEYLIVGVVLCLVINSPVRGLKQAVFIELIMFLAVFISARYMGVTPTL